MSTFADVFLVGVLLRLTADLPDARFAGADDSVSASISTPNSALRSAPPRAAFFFDFPAGAPTTSWAVTLINSLASTPRKVKKSSSRVSSREPIP